MTTIACTRAMAYIRCGSNKCLYGEAGAAALIDTIGIGTGDSMPAGVKSHHTREKNVFYFA